MSYIEKPDKQRLNFLKKQARAKKDELEVVKKWEKDHNYHNDVKPGIGSIWDDDYSEKPDKQRLKFLKKQPMAACH